MSDKDISNNVTRSTNFDSFIAEIELHEINTRYVENIVIYYGNGTKLKVKRSEIPPTLEVNNYNKWLDAKYRLSSIEDVKIFIDTKLLESDVNKEISSLLDIFT